jgi:hypothetical protein
MEHEYQCIGRTAAHRACRKLARWHVGTGNDNTLLVIRADYCKQHATELIAILELAGVAVHATEVICGK